MPLAIYDQLQTAPLTVHLTLALTQAQAGRVTSVSLPAGRFSVPDFGNCSPQARLSDPLTDPKEVLGNCRVSALREPHFTQIQLVAHNQNSNCDAGQADASVPNSTWKGSPVPRRLNSASLPCSSRTACGRRQRIMLTAEILICTCALERRSPSLVTTFSDEPSTRSHNRGSSASHFDAWSAERNNKSVVVREWLSSEFLWAGSWRGSVAHVWRECNLYLTLFCRASKDCLHERWMVTAAARVFRFTWRFGFALCFGVGVCSGVANWRGGRRAV